MIRKLTLAVAALIATMGIAFAQVDVNKADATALDAIKGVGPTLSKAILEERAKGQFKDWADFQKRVKGVGEKRAAKLSSAGLLVAGRSVAGAPAAKGVPAKATPAKATPAKAVAAKPAGVAGR